MDLDFKITGGRELDKALKLLGQRTEKKLIGRAVRAGGKVIVKEARRRVPVRSGRLKKSLGVKVIRLRGRQTAQVGPRREGKFGVRYGHLVEFGVPARGIPAKSFLRASADESKEAVVAAVGAALGADILAEVRKL